MIKPPFLSFSHKTIIVLLLLINLPFLLTWIMAKNMAEEAIMLEKERKLMALAKVTANSLPAEGFEGILQDRKAQNVSREQKIKILNEVLSPISDEMSSVLPGIGTGYYSRELDSIITYSPSSVYSYTVGKSIPQTHPGREVMSSNNALISFGSMVRGDIMNAMFPIERGGVVVGYVWVNELRTSILEQISGMSRKLAAAVLVCVFFACTMLILLSKSTVNNVDSIIKNVRKMRFDLSRRVPPCEGELGEVSESINAMAESISRANEDRERAIAVLQSVMSNVEAVVYVCDPHTKMLVYANEYLRKIMNGKELIGKICYEALQGFSQPCPFCPQKTFFDQQGKPNFTPVRWEFRNKHIKRDFMITDRLITWHDGRVLHMEVATDITERKALALAEASNTAQRDFLARMSHEIRTPMNGVLGMTHLAIQASPPPQQLEYLKKIQSSASLLLGIINDILDYSRIESGKIQIEYVPFKLYEMVDNIKELILPGTREKKLDFSINIQPGVPECVVGDGLRLSQILLNLLGNASKFTIKGGIKLGISSETLPSGRIRLFFRVDDSGIGISQKERQDLFKPFAQADVSTSRRFGGTGLGLSISKTLVEMMGGVINVESEPGKGSSFYFHVELDRFEGKLNSNENATIGSAMRFDGHNILLVEDNNINQEIALAVLEHLGIKADLAENGEEAVAAFMKKDYSLILMDVRMPIMDGIEATRLIRSSAKANAATIPIIAMTANVMDEDRKAGKNAGMDGYLAKPIDIEEFQHTMDKWLKQ